MSDKKINGLDSITDSQANDDTKLLFAGVSATGKLNKMTIAQGKKTFGVFKKTYRATGTEGPTLSISEVQGKEILAIYREGSLLYEAADSNPDSLEYAFNSTTITLGLAVQNPGERFLILYKNVISA